MTPANYTTKQAAERLQVSVKHIRDLIKLGALDAIDIARPGAKRHRFRIPSDAIDVFEARRVGRPAAEPAPTKPRPPVRSYV